jgi:hypothetical protein
MYELGKVEKVLGYKIGITSFSWTGCNNNNNQSKELDLHSSTINLLAFSSAESHIHKYVNVSFRTSFVVAGVVVAQSRG